MEKWFRGIFAGGGIALLVLALVWGMSKLIGPSRMERAALATMSEPVQFTGRNAYPAIWLMDYPVPAAEMDSVMAEDVRRVVDAPLQTPDGKFSVSTVVAAGRFQSDQPDQATRVRLCKPSEDCLAKVRGDLTGFGKWVDQHAAWFARAELATHADQLRNPFPPRVDMPLPSFVSVYAPATQLALRFAQGDREAAIASTCQLMVDWRTLGANTDMLIAWAVARGYGAEGYGKLLAQMLAEMPVDQPLPAECRDALTPPAAAEISMCAAMRGEFNHISRTMASMMEIESRKNGFKQKVFFDADMTKAMTAVPMAKYCAEETNAAFAADKTPDQAEEPGIYRLQCVSNAIGCILSRIAAPGYQGFELGHRDGLAMKRALAALAWWRNQPDGLSDPAATLARMPAEYRAAAHPLRLNEDKTALILPRLQDKKEEMVLPLPGTRIPAITR